ncbi:MAG: hypothetical protein UV78_C0008G0017 [Parcubacteria group bacterium GW2011_GWA2_43_17]|nr:MAG: hypothetical protein UV78_C0008G0017 [Parcubacteria group bacterium GW2011_GWA2_43_17]KKT94122.1 MAG: hypothetical protein UW91_C0005G0015 [Parcubacteria group bacterium GW2011_GWF2_45_11]KKT97027.1 MAG: hypothetical protein UW98_C0026G0004 [Parcubacteria group bacterium GW2011_GWC2_45_15]OGY94767.1 MAG: hypothetical protein A3J95_01260 [Candidatus Komeilibacteria bacterium RIFOXYC2_FULL_45_12]HAH04408.1 hypothetical protein [Candidatus Komeilibacteria bacterium]
MRATALKDKYTKEHNAMAVWVCVFAQSDDEYQQLLTEAKKLGDIFEETANGPKFLLNQPIAGTVRILKIRQPDPDKTERGDADFTISDYKAFKKEQAGQANFKIIPKDNFEMMELMEPGATVRAYFSYPSIEEQYQDLFLNNF